MGTCSVTTQVRGHHSWVNTAKAESKQLQLTEWATSAIWKSLQNQQQCMESFENFLQEQRGNRSIATIHPLWSRDTVDDVTHSSSSNGVAKAGPSKI